MSWNRRGNYSILFVLTVSVLVGYLALSVDAGRMRVAAGKAQNASEVAVIAALDVIRDGGNRNRAENAARAAARAISVSGSRGGGGSAAAATASPSGGGSGDVTLDIDWGRWDWEAGYETLDSRWIDNGSYTQSISIRAYTQGGSLGLIFAPVINNISEGSGRNTSGFDVGGFSRGALQNRDIVFVVDTSRFNDENLQGIRAGIANFLNLLEANGVPGDRVALVAYAGEAYTYDLLDPDGLVMDPSNPWGATLAMVEPSSQNALVEVEDNVGTIQQTVSNLMPCQVGKESWFGVYRHMDPVVDMELPGWGDVTAPPLWSYYLVGPNASRDGGPGFLVEPDDALMDWARNTALRSNFDQIFPTAGDWDVTLTESQQCAAWWVSELAFLLEDPRRSSTLENGGLTSPLECHEGNFFEDRADRYFDLNKINPVACAYPDLAPGIPRYDSPNPEIRGDRAHYQAGSNPGAGLARAATIFEDKFTNGEPTVILITSGGPRCGPNVEARASGCDVPFYTELSLAVQRLEAANVDAVTHVIGLVDAGSDDDVLLNDLVLDRGEYFQINNQNQVLGALSQIVGDMKIRVVR